MWRPDFEHMEARPARLYGFHRAMCILSNIYRGTDARPGLVLGLDRGGSCLGRAFLVAADQAETVRQKLYDRELVTGVYVPFTLPVCLDDGRKVPALAFVARRDHVQYFPPGDPEHAARLIRQGVGKAGTARDYLACTLEQMEALGIGSGALHRLLKLVEG